MSGNAESGRGGGTTTKKMLQSIKEIVGGNFSDDEIYAMLKDCNMDPSEAVHRLLNQDSFQEVKNKREKKKDVKENSEPRSRAMNSSNRGSKGASDRSSRSSSTHVSSNANYNKPMARRESGMNAAPVSSLSVPVVTKSYAPSSDFVPLDAGGGPSAQVPDQLPPQYLKGTHQSAWAGMPGQRTLADIVKMGRPAGKVGRAPPAVMLTNSDGSSHDVVIHASNEHLSSKLPISLVKPAEPLRESTTSSDSNILFAQGDSVGQHSSSDNWLLMDQPKVGTGGFADISTSSNSPVDGGDLRLGSQLDETQMHGARSLEGVILSEDSSMRNPHMEDGPMTDAGSFQHEIHNFEHNEIDVGKGEIASELQCLSLEKEDASANQHSDDNPAVIIPNHLQVTNADCSYLSFGTFGSGINTAFSGSFGSKVQESRILEAQHEASQPAPVLVEDTTDARNPEYYSNEHLGVGLNENAEGNQSSANVENYEVPPSSSQSDVIRSDSTDAMDGLPYRIQSSLPGYTFSNTGEPATAPSYASVQGNSSMQSLAPFSNVMQSYPSSLPSNLLSSGVPPQEYDLPHSSLLATQSMPTKYGTTMSSISGPSVSMPETAVKPGGSFSAAQPAMQSLPAASVPTGATALAQHLPPVAQYSQPTLPLGHFANMIGYPFLQSYTYMPSAAAAAFQQALAGGTTYHQSPVTALHAAGLKYTLPQYKNTAAGAVGNLPLSAATVPSGLPGFGGSPTLPANHHLLLNPSAAGSISPYDDLLTAQYKEQQSHQYPAPPPQQMQSESSMWMHSGGGSRAPAALSGAAAYYNLHQGPSQHAGSFRQSQQPAPYGAAGYPNFYHSQGSTAGQQDHLHGSGDGRLSGGQGQAAQPAAGHQHQHQHQMWQHNY